MTYYEILLTSEYNLFGSYEYLKEGKREVGTKLAHWRPTRWDYLDMREVQMEISA